MPKVRICVLSDIHGHLSRVPDCDLLLLCGDVSPFGELAAQVSFLDKPFRKWLEEQSRRGITVVGTAGNHDDAFHRRFELNLPWTYLEDSGTEAFGLKIWGTPWSKVFGDWAFMLDEDGLKEKYALVPVDTDVLISHGPPFGFGDKIPSRDLFAAAESVGSVALRERIDEVKPRLVCCGHIHDDYGVSYIGTDTVVINASYVDNSLRPANAPVFLEFEK